MKAFISYSHTDNHYLQRLIVHLAQMKRDNLITDWTDNDINVGNTLDTEICDNLNTAQLFIALVSPDYLASNYCYEREFKTALDLQDQSQLMIVPIIIQPCDWLASPFKQWKALPKDGKPISEWTSENAAFLNVIDELRRLILNTESTTALSDTTSSVTIHNQHSVRNYKVKKHFSEVDIFNFKEESFDILFNFFVSAIEEINLVESIQARFTDKTKDYFTCLISNRANNQSTYITIKVNQSKDNIIGDISYMYVPAENANTLTYIPKNIFFVSDDEYSLYWTTDRNKLYNTSSDSPRYSAKELADTIWNKFIAKVGVTIE